MSYKPRAPRSYQGMRDATKVKILAPFIRGAILSVSELAMELGVDASTLLRSQLSELEVQGLLEAIEDRPRKYRLSDRGKAFLEAKGGVAA